MKKENVRLLVEDEQPFKFTFLQGLDKFEQPESINDALKEADLVFLLDASDTKRFTKGDLQFDPKQKLIRIDHHASETDIDADLTFFDIEASSTSELVFRLFEETVDIDSNTAKALLLGIYDDTNSFSIENTSKKTFEIVAKLVGKGAKVMEIAEAVNTYDESILNGVKAFVNNMKFDEKVT